MSKKKPISRKTAKIRARRGKMWLSKVEPGNRLELPLALADEIDWLNAKAVAPIDAVVFPFDELNGVQLFPSEPKKPESMAELMRDFDKLIEHVAKNVQLSEEEEQQSRRILVNRWAVSIEVRKQSFRFTLPMEARKLKLLPDYPGVVVIFTSGENNSVELWEDSQWLQNLSASKSLLREKTDEYFADVASKGQINKTARRSK